MKMAPGQNQNYYFNIYPELLFQIRKSNGILYARWLVACILRLEVLCRNVLIDRRLFLFIISHFSKFMSILSLQSQIIYSQHYLDSSPNLNFFKRILT